MSKTFCIRPWVHTCIKTDGSFNLCCYSSEKSDYNIKTSTLHEWWTSDFVSDIRTKMLAGERPLPCESCYQQEDVGVKSYRQRSNQEYKIFDRYVEKTLNHFEYPKKLPIDIEMQLTNLCNLKCISCDENASSSILYENKILKINTNEQTKYNITDDELSDLIQLLHTGLKKLILRGGEPLIVPQIQFLLKYGVDNRLFDDTTIVLVTNGTKFNQEWYNILEKIKHLKIQLSIDSFGKLNEYIRFGSNWNNIDQTCKWMSSIPGVNFFIHAVVSNLSVLHLDKLIDWCNQNKFYLNWELIQDPIELQVTNLPDELKQLVIDRLQNKKNVHDLVTTLKNNCSFDNWEKFKTMIQLRESVRKNSLVSILPEFKPYM